MRVYLYILAADGGFAPNPFFGWCTLACCKPAVRRRAKAGDWVVGLTPKADGHRLAYAMRVQESLSFEEYWNDPRFERKRPHREKGTTRRERHGDNCYEPDGKGSFRQLPGDHYDNQNNRENPGAKKRDLGGKRVLIARRFSYYGADAIAIPEQLTFPRPARYNRVPQTSRASSSGLRHSLKAAMAGREDGSSATARSGRRAEGAPHPEPQGLRQRGRRLP